jgi:nickel-dependent lactate racemase
MRTFRFKYGEGKIPFSLSSEEILMVIEPNPMPSVEKTGDEIVKEALDHPISSGKLRDLVKEGETVCVVVPDVTRAWQSPSVYVPPVIEELTKAGVKDKDIVIISATGSHRKQTEEEYISLVGADVNRRIEIIDHDCKDEDNLVQVGITSFGTPVWINKRALECDHIVMTGGAILHFLAGYGGGRKYILPGIAGYETIMRNHSYSMSEGMGAGSNPEVRSGNMTETNDIHQDMMEAAAMVKPLFILNVVVDSDKRITHAFAGEYIKAHRAACEIVKQMDSVTIQEKADLVIASAGGYPKDINFYQTTKSVFNAVEAVKPGGAMIIVSECREGFGSGDTEAIIRRFSDMLSREKDIRKTYTIGKFLGYRPAEIAEKVHFILVSSMDPTMFGTTKIKVVSTIGEAISLGRTLVNTENPSIALMPYAANTLPMLQV